MSKDPERKIIGNKHYRLYVGLVATYHADGMPRLISTIKPEQIVELAGGEHFVSLSLPDLDWTEAKRLVEEQVVRAPVAPADDLERPERPRDAVEVAGIVRGLRIVRDTGLTAEWPAAARAAFDHALRLADLAERLIG